MPALFDSLYNESKDAEATRKKGFIQKKVERGFSAAIDGLQEKKLDAENSVQGVQKAVANGQISRIADLAALALEIQECAIQITELEKQKKVMLG